MSNNSIQPLFRDYTSLHTGNDGEKGYKDITLNYTFYDQDYLIIPDSVTLIRTAPSLYPYEQININDTTFVNDGAYGSLTPYISDKIYKPVGLNDTTSNQQYLVTWLSAGKPGDYGVWMDRYFYPDVISRVEALSTSTLAGSAMGVLNPSFLNPVQESIYSDLSALNFVKYNKVFDKISDLVIQPESVYYYDRVGPTAINKFVSTFDNLLIAKDFNNYYNSLDKEISQSTITSITFNRDNYFKYPVDQINQTGSFVLKFDIINDWNINTFHALFGSKLADGFSVINDKAITPFSFVFYDKDLKVYNSDLTLLYSLSFEDSIKDVIVGDHLDDYHITTNTALYKLNSFGHIKSKTIFPILSAYINYDINDDNSQLTLLLNSSGSCYQINLDTLIGQSTTVSYYTLSAPPINGIKYIDNIPYLFKGEKIRYYDNRYLFHLYGNKELYREDLITRDIPTSVFCTTSSIIYDFNIDKDNRIVLSHEDRKLTILDNSRTILDTKILSLSSSPFTIDFISEYSQADYEFSPIVLFNNPLTNTAQIARLTNNYTVLSSVNTGLSASFTNTLTSTTLSATRIKNITNYNFFQNDNSSKYLNFDLTLRNYYSVQDTFRSSIKIPLSVLVTDIQTFIVRLDENDGVFEVYKDNQLFESVQFNSYKYKFNLPLTNHFVMGSTAFYNNQTLANYLGQQSHYFVGNVVIENFKLYYDSLKPFQIYPLMLESKRVDNLCLTLPCDQRNNIEEITKTFAFTQPWIKSNNINIVIKNTGIISSDQQSIITNNILLNSSNTLPADVNINSIRFEE